MLPQRPAQTNSSPLSRGGDQSLSSESPLKLVELLPPGGEKSVKQTQKALLGTNHCRAPHHQ